MLLDVVPPGCPGPGGEPDLAVHDVPLVDLDDGALLQLSREGGLALNVREMRAVQAHFVELGREPRRIELETIAQTWSEHCKHKTLTGRIRFGDEVIDNLLKSEIARVTRELDRDFCVSVFEDNAGVIDFDGEDCVCIKVETHNHPSAIEPFGGAATGVGGVIRDILGTGLGARPVANTDVFCFAPVDTPEDAVPKGCLHPLRVLRGVVAGVRDYGNPMGIPTVHGAVHFDPDFVGNPLVYVGNIGIMPRAAVRKAQAPATRSSSSAGAPAVTGSTARRSARSSCTPRARPCRAARSRSATPSPSARRWTSCCARATRACSPGSPTAAPAASRRRSARWRRSSAPTSTCPARR